MAIERVNPYREGSNYHRIFGFVQDMKKNAFTNSMLQKRFEAELEITGKIGSTPLSAGKASINVVTGPTKDSQGNYSSAGHKYFMERLKRKASMEDGKPVKYKEIDGKPVAVHNVNGKLVPYKGKIVKEEQRMLLRWRKEEQVKLRREDAFLTAEQIAERNQRKADAKAEREEAKAAEVIAKAERAEARKVKREEKAAEAATAKDAADLKRKTRKEEKAVEEKAAQDKRDKKAKDRKETADAKETAAQAKRDKREQDRKDRVEAAEAAKQAKADAKAEAKEVPAETEDAETVSESATVEEGEIAEA